MPTANCEQQLSGNFRRDHPVEAVPVGVLSGDNVEPRLSHASVARGHVVVVGNSPPSDRYHPPVRDNAPVQCCYPITVVDPEEVVQARHIAIAQASFEAMLVMFCQSGWCALAWLIAMPFSITVASCCKHRVTYIAWGSTNVLVCWFHVAAAAEALGRHDGDLSNMGYSSEFLVTVQMFLFSLGVLAVYVGFKTASALRSEVLPHARAEVLSITEGSPTYLTVEEHYPQPLPMSVPLR